MALAVLAVACAPNGPGSGANGSLFLMNQTHDVRYLSRFRGQGLDCTRGSQDPQAELEHATFQFEGCFALEPAEVVALDRESMIGTSVACDAVAFRARELAPQALFWNDLSLGYSGDRTKAGAVAVLLAVGETLVLEPAAAAALVTLDALPEGPCSWGR